MFKLSCIYLHKSSYIKYIIFSYPSSSSFLLKITSTATHARQSQYFAHAALISLPCSATPLAFFAPPNTFAPASDSANAISLSIGIISSSISAMNFFVYSACLSVPTTAWCCNQPFCYNIL